MYKEKRTTNTVVAILYVDSGNLMIERVDNKDIKLLLLPL